MSTDAAGRAADRIAYGAVHLDVVDAERSLAFWRDAIGLTPLTSEGAEIRLGAADRALIVLHPGATAPVAPGHTGLYHVAIHVPDDVEFARTITRLHLEGVRQSPTDHVFSKATYVHDPDGIMVELTLETPEEYGSVEVGPTSVVLRDREGRERAGTAPLDMAAALRPLADHDPREPLVAGTTVGHVHLHVADLRRSFAFYRDVVGFEEHAYMEPIGMADLGAGGVFPHRIALNDWQGPRARPAQAGTAGLRRFELVLADGAELSALIERAAVDGIEVEQGEGTAVLLDPAGNRIAVGVNP